MNLLCRSVYYLELLFIPFCSARYPWEGLWKVSYAGWTRLYSD
jgi:hypothetical protein